MAVPIKITDSLIVSVPVKYIRYELLTCGATANGIPRDGPPSSKSINFDFFLPNLSGFTVKSVREPFSVNEVHVASVASAAQAGFGPKRPAPDSSEQIKNFINGHEANPSKYRDIDGLRCYEGGILKNRNFCYSRRTGQDAHAIFLIVDVPPYARGLVNPLMRADYYSSRYGGIEINWWANAENLPHWRDIDAQIWRLLAEWNVARPTKAAP